MTGTTSKKIKTLSEAGKEVNRLGSEADIQSSRLIDTN